MAKHRDSDPVTWGDFRKIVKHVRALETGLADAFEAITKGDGDQAEFWNEHEEKLERLRRSQNRIKKRLDALEE